MGRIIKVALVISDLDPPTELKVIGQIPMKGEPMFHIAKPGGGMVPVSVACEGVCPEKPADPEKPKRKTGFRRKTR